MGIGRSPGRCVSPAASGCPSLEDSDDLRDLQSARFDCLLCVLKITDLDGLGQEVAEKARTRQESGRKPVLAMTRIPAAVIR